VCGRFKKLAPHNFREVHLRHSLKFSFDSMTSAVYWHQLLSSYGITPQLINIMKNYYFAAKALLAALIVCLLPISTVAQLRTPENIPIGFYGKVIDKDGNAVVRASVSFVNGSPIRALCQQIKRSCPQFS
jgi:hypothetical protein